MADGSLRYAPVVTGLRAPLALRFARLVKLEHTVFALPFAYVGMLLAAGEQTTGADAVWVTLAMIGARTLAMALNRLVDRTVDARNPRTRLRELPAGALSVTQVGALCLAALAVYAIAAWQLHPVVRPLVPIPVVLFIVYPYLKRATWACHLWLGVSLGLAPVGAWLAVSGSAPWEAWVLAAAVALWVTGFDLFYALLDLEHDRSAGLHSWATRFGVQGVFNGARSMHALAVVGIAVVVGALGLGAAGWVGVATVAALLGYEHSIIRPTDLRRLNAAFFTVNGAVSIAFCLAIAVETLA